MPRFKRQQQGNLLQKKLHHTYYVVPRKRNNINSKTTATKTSTIKRRVVENINIDMKKSPRIDHSHK